MPDHPPPREGPAEGPHPPAETLRVLVVDDDAVNSFVTSKMLERLDHRVELVSTGAQATDAVRREDCDVVLGSRYLHGITVVNWPIERILISYFGNWYARRITGLPIRDTTGGFRCMRRSLLERIGFERSQSNGYAFQIELNYRFVKHGARIKEIEFFFLDRTRGTSKLTPRIGLEALWFVWWLRIADWLGRL